MMPTDDPDQAEGGAEPPTRPTENRLVLLVALLVLSAATLFAFLVPHMSGDTFMTLAGGRDVAAGKLATPDDWSFVSEGRVWINQSWLTGWLFYELWMQLGPTGLLVYKAVALSLIALFLVLSARQFRASLTVGVLTTAYIMACLGDAVSLRANLLGLAMLSMLMWLLFVSYRRPQRIWWSVGLLTLWAQMHGSFIFGIAVLGLWAVINELLARRQRDEAPAAIKRWPYWAAVVVAPLLAAVTSPFGITNLAQPFTLMGFFLPESWPLDNREMSSILRDHPEVRTYPALSWYLFMLGALAAPLVLRFSRPTNDIPRIADLDRGRRSIWLFSLTLAAITIIMTLFARRFLAVCLIACGPLLAFEAHWVFSHRRYAWPAAIAAVAAFGIGFVLERSLIGVMYPQLISGSPAPPSVLRLAWGAAALVLALSPYLGWRLVDLLGNPAGDSTDDQPPRRQWLTRLSGPQGRCWSPLVGCLPMLAALGYLLPSLLNAYRMDNPRMPNHGVFGRMVVLGEFPEAGAEFLAGNQIAGNTLQAWMWEGYLHWKYPELKLMVGGRSRQVYSPRAASDWKAAMLGKDESIYPELGIQLLVLPAHYPLAVQPLTDPQSPWRILFFDGQTIIAAWQDDPGAAQWLADFQSGHLRYPTERSLKYTVAARNLAAVSDSGSDEILSSVAAAARVHPSPHLYQLLLDQPRAERVPLPNIVSFCERELSRLHGIDYHRAEGFAYLQSRQQLAGAVANYYTRLAEATRTAPDRKRISFWRQYAEDCKAAGIALLKQSAETPIREIPEQFTRS